MAEDNQNQNQDKSKDVYDVPDSVDELRASGLGIAGRMACMFIDSPISPLLMIVTLSIGLSGNGLSHC